jgi:hypothetical protein
MIDAASEELGGAVKKVHFAQTPLEKGWAGVSGWLGRFGPHQREERGEGKWAAPRYRERVRVSILSFF